MWALRLAVGLGDFVSCICGPLSSRLLVMVRPRGWALMDVARWCHATACTPNMDANTRWHALRE